MMNRASGVAKELLGATVLGGAARPRGFHFEDRPTNDGPGTHHADIVGTRPDGFEKLPLTPTPGIYKD